MPAYVLHPMFAGRVVSVDLPLEEDVSATKVRWHNEVSSVSTLSMLPTEEIASLVARVHSDGGSLEDSDAPFLR